MFSWTQSIFISTWPLSFQGWEKTNNSSTFTTSFLLTRPPIPCGGGAQHLSTTHEMPVDKVTWTSSEMQIQQVHNKAQTVSCENAPDQGTSRKSERPHETPFRHFISAMSACSFGFSAISIFLHVYCPAYLRIPYLYLSVNIYIILYYIIYIILYYIILYYILYYIILYYIILYYIILYYIIWYYIILYYIILYFIILSYIIIILYYIILYYIILYYIILYYIILSYIIIYYIILYYIIYAKVYVAYARVYAPKLFLIR